jgi:hypothetical protein
MRRRYESKEKTNLRRCPFGGLRGVPHHRHRRHDAVRTERLSDLISQFGLDGEIMTSIYYQEFLAGVKREFSGKGKN